MPDPRTASVAEGLTEAMKARAIQQLRAKMGPYLRDDADAEAMLFGLLCNPIFAAHLQAPSDAG
jgi:hypothetical protein